VSCVGVPLRWFAGGRQPSGGRCTRAHFGEGGYIGSPEAPRRAFTASAVNDREGGRTRFWASARVRVKLVATLFACAPSFVASCRDKRRLRSTGVTAQTRLRAFGFAVVRACPSGDGDSIRTPSGARGETEDVALAESGTGDFAPQFLRSLEVIWNSSASCCGQTLKWRPRVWEAERSRCLHRKRSTR
jgi:hypothetical protein